MVFDICSPFLLDETVQLQTVLYRYKMVLSHRRINHIQLHNSIHRYRLILLLRNFDNMQNSAYKIYDPPSSSLQGILYFIVYTTSVYRFRIVGISQILYLYMLPRSIFFQTKNLIAHQCNLTVQQHNKLHLHYTP